jgi:hypothetical protein
MQAKLVFVGLQQRLLSSTAAFARTLEVHRKGLVAAIEHAVADVPEAAASAFSQAELELDDVPLDGDEGAAERTVDLDEEAAAAAASSMGSTGATTDDLQDELASVDEMLAIAKSNAARPDARVAWLVRWIEQNMLTDGRWNERRLILFTEYEDTRRWLEKRLLEALDETDRADERIGVFTGITGMDRRESIKRAFNADPAVEPLRILICTDAAREGINLQTRCHDLIHVDLPWNPSRLEQRNGRIDRKLQPAPQVFCRYFLYAQREEDVVLDALVRKTETIRTQLGSIGQVIEERISKRLTDGGIVRGSARLLANAVLAENDTERLALARAEMNDETDTRRERLLRDLDDLRKVLEDSRKRVGVDSKELEQVVGTALARAGGSLDDAKDEPVGTVETFRFDPASPVFAKDRGWHDAFDDLRTRRRKRGERPSDWRAAAPIRSVAFEPPIQADQTDAPDVVQVHLEHRLVRRLLSRFLSQGFQADLARVTVVFGPGAQPRVVMLGRLALYGPRAARLHEEVLPVTAVWTEAGRARAPLKPLGTRGEETTLVQLEQALRDTRQPPQSIVDRVRALARQDAQDLESTLRDRAVERQQEVERELGRRGDAEAQSLGQLLEAQRTRILKASRAYNPNEPMLPGVLEAERRQFERDRRHWTSRLAEIEQEIEVEPARARASYDVRAHRLEPVGLVYLWPVSG